MLRSSRKTRLILLAIFLGVLFWVIESGLMAFLFHAGEFRQQIFSPAPHEIWQRLLVFGFMLGFAFHAEFLLAKHKKKDDALQASEDKYRRLVELSPDLIAIQCDDQILFINSAGAKLLGAENTADLLGKSIWDFAIAENMGTDNEHNRQRIVIGFGTLPIEGRFRRMDGTFFDAEISATPFVHESRPATQVIVRNMTERILEEKRIQQHKKELQALYTVSASVSRDSGIQSILHEALAAVLALDWIGNGASGMLFLFDESQHSLQLVAAHGVSENHPCLQKPPDLGECLCGLAAQEGEMIFSEDGWLNPRHTRRWLGIDRHIDICLPLKVRGKVLGVMNLRLQSSQAVTEADIGLLQSVANQIGVVVENSRLHDLNQKVIFTERERIARDLHDDMGQLLGYVNTKVMAAQLNLKNRQYLAAQKNLLHLEQATRRLSVDVRKAILDLRSSGSEKTSGNLIATLKNYLTQLNQLSDLNVRLDVTPGIEDLIIAPESVMQLLRIVQEALTNVLKHAETTDVSVVLNSVNGSIELSINDKGSGFDASGLGQSQYPRYGMISMRERAEQLGGTFHVDSAPGGGTRVIASIPAPKRVQL